MEKSHVLQTVGRRIQKLRKRAKLSQDELAERVGMHRNHIGLVERGERNASLTALAAIADGLGVSLAQLFDE